MKFIYRSIYRVYKEIVLAIKLMRFHLRIFSSAPSRQFPHQYIHVLWKTEQEIGPEEFFLKNKVDFKKATYVYYVGPQSTPWFRDVSKNYPQDAALKILKTAGKADERIYIRAQKKPVSQSLLFPNSHEMLFSCNYLSTCKITPRIYDLTYLQFAGKTFVTFVVQNVEGGQPEQEECERFMNGIKGLIDKNLLSVISARPWYKTEDFACPACSGNLLKEKNTGSLFYVDFQNLVIERTRALKRELDTARSHSHFGSQYLVRGGRYLYQSIPEFSEYGKRATDRRWDLIEDMLRKNDLTLKGKVVFDVGCNIGMIMRQSLSRGACWCIGWDKADLIPHTDRILSLLGYSRYTLYGTKLTNDYIFADELPDHLSSVLDDSFLFFLSMRDHIGFPADLLKLPWKYMVYEDHQDQGRNIKKYLQQISEVIDIRVLFHDRIADGDSRDRPILLLEKT